jgi:hypothetical protein
MSDFNLGFCSSRTSKGGKARAAKATSGPLLGLGRALTRRQLQFRRRLTLWGVPLPVGAALPAWVAWSGASPATLVAALLLGAAITAALQRILLARVPRIWEPVGDFEMVQLLDLARKYPLVGSMVREVNESGRDFVVQDWLQAREVELQTGLRSQAEGAALAMRALRTMHQHSS